MKRVVVIGGDHHNTLGVIRSLGRTGICPDVIVVSKDGKSFVGKSKYIHTFRVVNYDNEITPCLNREFVNFESKAIVICCSDGASSEVDLHSESLNRFFILPGSSEEGRISKLMNKKTMAEMAVACGLSVPQTFYPQKFPIKNEEVSFPCIIKPLVSKNGTKEDIHICDDIEKLNSLIGSIGVENLLIQQFIDKDYEYQLMGCSTGDDIIIPGVSHILRPCKGSNTSFLYYERLNTEIYPLEQCKSFVRQTGYRGLFSIEFLRDKTGKDYFMEINFRNDGNSICVTESGVNLPYIWYLYCCGENYKDECNHPITPKYVMPDSAELRLLLTKQINIFQYLSDLFKTDHFMEFDWKDLRPFLEMIRMKSKYLWKKSI